MRAIISGLNVSAMKYHHLIVLNQIGTLDEPRFNRLCEDAVKTAKELSDELTEKLDIEIEKAKEVNT